MFHDALGNIEGEDTPLEIYYDAVEPLPLQEFNIITARNKSKNVLLNTIKFAAILSTGCIVFNNYMR